jgi:hypothetical protein
VAWVVDSFPISMPYIYGYSLTRVQMTRVDKIGGLHGPMGQFIDVKRWWWSVRME